MHFNPSVRKTAQEFKDDMTVRADVALMYIKEAKIAVYIAAAAFALLALVVFLK